MTITTETMEAMIGDLILHAGFLLMRWREGLVRWRAPEMACARRMCNYKWN